uniref:ShKT domain-containing protein n=1 Tax=Parastrongyloides trichosuri TaxID=131310 RepID=A0A0N4ZXI8_PARTI
MVSFTFKNIVIIFLLINFIQLSYTDSSEKNSLLNYYIGDLALLKGLNIDNHRIEKRQARSSSAQRRRRQAQRRRFQQMINALNQLQQQITLLQQQINATLFATTTTQSTTSTTTQQYSSTNTGDKYSVSIIAKVQPAVVTPCCIDMLSPGVCRLMMNRDQEKFNRQCRNNADFSFLQCCYSCHFSSQAYVGLTASGNELYEEDAVNMLLNPYNATNEHCFDRHGTSFCESLVKRQGRWGSKTTSCSQSSLAFRVCRRSCGYCSDQTKQATVRYDSEVARDMKKCSRLF